jgi:hypothetical protein
MQRCADLAKRWHLALAVGTATSIHLEGPGRFYLTRLNINLALLDSPCRELSIAVVLGRQRLPVGTRIRQTQPEPGWLSQHHRTAFCGPSRATSLSSNAGDRQPVFSSHDRVAPGRLAEPLRAELRRSLLGLEVHVDHPTRLP